MSRRCPFPDWGSERKMQPRLRHKTQPEVDHGPEVVLTVRHWAHGQDDPVRNLRFILPRDVIIQATKSR